jgi:hypothetical protein
MSLLNATPVRTALALCPHAVVLFSTDEKSSNRQNLRKLAAVLSKHLSASCNQQKDFSNASLTPVYSAARRTFRRMA